MEVLEEIELANWDGDVSERLQTRCVSALEYGKILFLPRLAFPMLASEADLLSPQLASGKTKNISFNSKTGHLGGASGSAEVVSRLKDLLARFSTQAASLAGRLLPRYQAALEPGRTSFRPVEIEGRVSSYKKDDTRLHIDAFPSSPVQDRRILRVFSNVNPNGQERVWRAGEPFERVAAAFLPRARKQLPAEAPVLRAFKITKSLRTPYDHCMLELHDRMKADTSYQRSVEQTEIRFPAGSTWIVFTDQVSHAALAGQCCLEHTMYLPVDAMMDPARSPLRVLENLSGRRLT